MVQTALSYRRELTLDDRIKQHVAYTFVIYRRRFWLDKQVWVGSDRHESYANRG